MYKICSTFAADFENYTIMNAAAQQKAEYNVMYSSELPHYMSLEEMHERLTAKIHETYSLR